MDIVECVGTFWTNVTAVWGIVPMLAGLTWKTVAYLLGAIVVWELVEENL